MAHRDMILHVTAGILLWCCIAGSLADDGDITCPGKCNCSVAMDWMTCEEIPVFGGRGKVHTLIITKHSITTINTGDFANFSALSQLSITSGLLGTRIKKLTKDSFFEIRDTVTMIDLSHNGIETLEETFVNFTKLKDLILNFNALTKLEAGTFVNMPSLLNVKFEFNSITEIEADAFKDLPRLDSVNFFSNKLTVMPWNGLRGLSSLNEIDVSRNKISSVGESTDVRLENLEEIILTENSLMGLGSFPNVSSKLKVLNIGFNHIDTISLVTWRYVPELERLYMDGTWFYEFTQGMFDGLNNLKFLYMTDLPHLQIIGPHAFAGLGNVHEIDLSRNRKLTTIFHDTFVDINVSKVLLSKCALEHIPEAMLKWNRMDIVQIAPNPINCDCNAQWLTNSSVIGNSSDVSDLVCAAPEKLAGNILVSLAPGQFICTHAMNHGSRFTTAVAVALIVATLMITFALLFKFRHRISLTCGHYFKYRRYRNDMIFTVEHDTSVGELEEPEGRPLKDLHLETVPLDENA